jgi:hypothetical protein
VLDAQQIYHRREPRDLSAAVLSYCGREHADARGALADAEATAAVLDAQVARYADLPPTVAALHELLTRTWTCAAVFAGSATGWCSPSASTGAGRSTRWPWGIRAI